MKKKISLLNILWTVLALVFLAAMFYIKGNYYYNRFLTGWFGPDREHPNIAAIIWVVISFVISSLPMMAVVIGNVLPKVRGDLKWQLIPLILCICNIIFEVLSMFGSGLTLDRTWSAISDKMFEYQAVSLVLILVILIVSWLEKRKEQ